MNIDYENPLQKVLNAIENDLEYITIEELIRVSGYSYYHFHRIFKTFVGESLKRYIKRLQMERALFKMRVDQDNITKIAMSSGFETQSSFNKAFKKMFNINPSEYKHSLALKRQEYKEILPLRFEKIEAMEVYTIRHVGEYEELDESWSKLIEFASKNSLFCRDFFAYAITYDNPEITNKSKLRCDACISKIKDVNLDTEDKISSKKLFGGKYAVFLHRGKHSSLADTYNSIFGNWLFTQNERLRNVPVIEKFLNNKYEVSEDRLLTEVYVPIVK